MGLIAGTIATGVLAVIICSMLVVVTLFYWKNKNKYDEEEIPNEIRFGFDLSSFPVVESQPYNHKHPHANNNKSQTLLFRHFTLHTCSISYKLLYKKANNTNIFMFDPPYIKIIPNARAAMLQKVLFLSPKICKSST